MNRARDFAHCYWLPHPDRGHGSSHDRGDLAHLRHQFVELVGEEGLRAVGEGLIRVVMHFDHQSVGAYGDCRAR